MQDNEIIKLLECCSGKCEEDCQKNCPIEGVRGRLGDIFKDSLDLINRQKAEIKQKDTEIEILIRKKEALRDEIAEQQAEIEEYRAKHKELYKKLSNVQAMAIMVNERADEIKAEAYKEFAERLKEKADFLKDDDDYIGYAECVRTCYIDNLLTKLTKGEAGK